MSNLQFWMARALAEAEKGAEGGAVPVGAVLVEETPDKAHETLLAQACNSPKNPLEHAEIQVLFQASHENPTFRYSPHLTLYVTLEPCPMCAHAMRLARISKLVFGAYNPKQGAIFHNPHAPDSEHFEIIGGVLEEPCGRLLKNFFQSQR